MRKDHNDLPQTLDAFDRRRATFETWLIEHGSAIKAPTNPFEVIRFTGPNTECVVYRRSNNVISYWGNGADKAYKAFLHRTEWRAVDRGKRDQRSINLVLSLAARDGWQCCYCAAVLNLETATIEHFVAITSGGNSHLANLTLSCEPCNTEVGHLPVRQKLEFAVKKRTMVDSQQCETIEVETFVEDYTGENQVCGDILVQ